MDPEAYKRNPLYSKFTYYLDHRYKRIIKELNDKGPWEGRELEKHMFERFYQIFVYEIPILNKLNTSAYYELALIRVYSEIYDDISKYEKTDGFYSCYDKEIEKFRK